MGSTVGPGKIARTSRRVSLSLAAESSTSSRFASWSALFFSDATEKKKYQMEHHHALAARSAPQRSRGVCQTCTALHHKLTLLVFQLSVATVECGRCFLDTAAIASNVSGRRAQMR